MASVFLESILNEFSSRLLKGTKSTDDNIQDDALSDSTQQQRTLKAQNSLLVGFIVMVVILMLFEINRQKKWIYHRRLTKRLQTENRAPKPPYMYPLGWLVSVLHTSDEEVLKMVGLDAYMFLRVQLLCFKSTLFFTIMGMIILVPLYATSNGGVHYWGQYTIANIPLSTNANYSESGRLWATTIMMYVYSFFVCRLLYYEYKVFFEKRIHFMINGDPETPKQANYTVMLENVPISLRSVPKLRALFDKLFPGQVYCIEIALDLGELEKLCATRKVIRNNLEKAIAISNAYAIPYTVNLTKEFFKNSTNPSKPVGKSSFWGLFGYELYDAVEVYEKKLDELNKDVLDRQRLYYNKAIELESLETPANKEHIADDAILNLVNDDIHELLPFTRSINSSRDSESPRKVDQAALGISVAFPDLEASSLGSQKKKPSEQSLLENDSFKAEASKISTVNNPVIRSTLAVAEDFISKEVQSQEKFIGSTLGLFIPGTTVYYRHVGTAFVTFKTRIAKVYCERAMLSHRYFQMKATSAPNPNEIIWPNIPTHLRLQKYRGFFANCLLFVLAFGWSALAYVVSNLSEGLNSFSYIPWIADAQSYFLFRIFGQYIFLLLLLLLMALLPLFFDAICRRYEGIKTETWIHESIMQRYFYYQLAYVLSTTGLSGLTTSGGCLANGSCEVAQLIGKTLPSFSSFFVTLLVFKAFIQMPVSLIRGWPLIRIATVKFCCLLNRKKVTRREIRNGIFFDPPMLYGWYYPSILMVVLIFFVFAVLAPVLMPVACVFFMFTYIVYKHHLLYVYVDFYQAGGVLFVSVFNQIMLSNLIAVLCLLCYYSLGGRLIAPFYALLPILPLLFFFWHTCQQRFQEACQFESLEVAIEVDKQVEQTKAAGLPIPHDEFRKTMYRQRCLTEKPLSPADYRCKNKDFSRDESIRIPDAVDRDGLPPTVMAEAAWVEEVDYFDREAEDNIHLEIDNLLEGEAPAVINSTAVRFKELARRARDSVSRLNRPDSPNLPLGSKTNF